MKVFNVCRRGALLLLLAFATTMFVACDKEEEVLTGEITFRAEPKISFDFVAADKAFAFKCTEAWHVDIAPEYDWIKVNPMSGEGSDTRQRITVSVAENTLQEERKGEITIVSGENRSVITIVQARAAKVLTDKEITELVGDVSRVYPGHIGDMSKLAKSSNTWFWGRCRQSEHFIVFWDNGYDEYGNADPNDESVDESIRVDVDDLLYKAEIYYDTYINKLNFAGEPGQSFLDRYKMSIFLFGTTSWRAEGGGSGDMGALWVSATACQPTGSTVAHEIAHAFQYQVFADFGQSDAGFMQIGGLFWEQCGNWQSYNLYAEQAFNSANFQVFTENYHRHFHHEHQRYASYWYQWYWTDTHGLDAYGRIWKESKRTEDAVQAYMRLYCDNDIAKLNESLYRYAAKCATWDFSSVVVNLDERGQVSREAPVRDFGQDYIGKLGWLSSSDADGYYKVAYARCPEPTGFNVIRLALPEEGASRTIKTQFVGMPNAEGYNATRVDASTAGWTYGYVALLADNSRAYSDPVFTGAELSGEISWEVPASTVKLWLVVSCTPTKYYGHTWDEDNTNDLQYPYRVRFEGTDLFGTIKFDGTETPHDVTITKDVQCSAAAGFSGPAIVLGDDDLLALGQAFVMQPNEIVAKLPASRDKVQQGEVKFGAINPDGGVSYEFTANGYGHWFDASGTVVPYKDGSLYSEFSPASWTFQLGLQAKAVNVGDTFTIRQALIYGDNKAVFEFNVTVVE